MFPCTVTENSYTVFTPLKMYFQNLIPNIVGNFLWTGKRGAASGEHPAFRPFRHCFVIVIQMILIDDLPLIDAILIQMLKQFLAFYGHTGNMTLKILLAQVKEKFALFLGQSRSPSFCKFKGVCVIDKDLPAYTLTIHFFKGLFIVIIRFFKGLCIMKREHEQGMISKERPFFLHGFLYFL